MTGTRPLTMVKKAANVRNGAWPSPDRGGDCPVPAIAVRIRTPRHDPRPEGAMIQLCNIEKIYRGRHVDTVALGRINLEIQAGEFVSIMGPSGSGKSTLLGLIGLLDEPSAGVINVEGRPVTSYDDREISALRNRMFGFVFQRGHLVPDLRVLDNVELPLLYRHMPHRERRRLAQAALERVGLSSRAHHYPGELSGGQQQRVALARAIAGCPLVLLADEPAGNLDTEMGNEVMDLLGDLNQGENTTVVMVTHDPRHAARSRRIVRLLDGRQVA
jgi:putative ABC transport system ATP-binding protein